MQASLRTWVVLAVLVGLVAVAAQSVWPVVIALAVLVVTGIAYGTSQRSN